MPTPCLEKLAGEGMVFTNAHCAAPTCSPSRAALLTGVSAHEAGMLGLAHRGFSLRHPERHLAAFLRRNGYETALSGILHVFRGDAEMPYDHVLRAERVGDHQEYDRDVARQASEFLKGDRREPFFLDCGFWSPHRPFPEPGRHFDPAKVSVPKSAATLKLFEGNAEVRRDWASFLTAVESMDACCGRVLDALQEAGLAGETIVVFSVDHGIAFPGMKCHLNAGGTGVSLIVRGPGVAGGRRCDALVSHLDLYPTICEAAGLAVPEYCEGESLRALFADPNGVGREEVFSEVNWHASFEPMRAVRTEEYLYVEVLEEDLRPVPANIDDSPAKAILIEKGLLNARRERVRLYDLKKDPEEKKNVAGMPEYEGVRKEMVGRLRAWMERTEDPILNGPLKLPEGAWCNPREHLSAEEGE